MKKKTIQRAFAWALTLVMVLSAAPLGVFAEGEGEQKCICTVKCGETGNAECPVCNENAEKCAVTAQKQEEPETKETPMPPKAENPTPENKVEKKTEETPGNTGNPPAAGGDKKTNPEADETPDPVESGQGGPTKTKPFTVTFNVNGGDPAPEPMTTKEDGTLNGTLPTPTRAGHTFGGWFETQDCTGTKVEQNKTYGGDTTLYAKWTENTPTGTGTGSSGNKKEEPGNTGTESEKKTYKITFDTQEKCNNPAEMTTGEDGKLSELPAPTATGYTFDGWYLDANCSEDKAVNKNNPFTENTTLYAKWTKTAVVVTFDFQDVSIQNQQKTVNADGKLDGPLPEPSKTGYNFLGWYLTTDYTNAVTEETKFDKDTTVYAKWQKQPQAVTVTFNAGEGHCGMTSATVNKDNKLDSLPIPTWEGHAFLGWYKNTGEKATLDTRYDENTTLVARWVALETPSGVIPAGNFLEGKDLEDGTKKVAIRVVPVNGPGFNEIKSKLGVDGEKLAVYDLSVQMLGSEDRELGFLSPVNGLIEFKFDVNKHVAAVYHIKDDGAIETMSKDKKPGYSQTGSTLTIWADSFSPYAIAIDGYRITLDARGGTLAADVPNPIITKLDGTLKEPLPTPTKTGYTFGGWYLTEKCEDDEKVENNSKFESNATIYAKWAPITYKVVFHDNYRTPEKTDTQTPLTYDKEERLSYDETKIKREYYQLDGWAETRDGEQKYGTNQQVKNLCSQQGAEKHLYAVWSYQRKTVIFDADGGKIKENGQEVYSVIVQTQESPINTVKAKEVPVPMTREGYYFGGWYTQKEGKGDLVKPDKTEFTEGRTTVYAYWIEFKPVTVTFKCQGGTARIGSADVKEFTMQTKWPGVLDGTPTTPSRSSYKFEGWYTAAGVKVDEDTLFLKDATVYARWKRAVSITGNPRTGDQVKLEAAIAILVAAAIGLGATVVLKKRKDK